MKNNKLEELTKEIQKQVPEIMELKFGCNFEIEYHKGKIGNYTICENTENVRSFVQTESKRGYEKVYIETLGKIKILGRDITLEDILFFIEKLYPASNASIHTTGAFIINEKFSDCFWELNKPLHKQDEDMINYLYDLIIKE